MHNTTNNMTILVSYENDGDSIIETTEFGYISNYTICNIFGDEMTFNELKKINTLINADTFLVITKRPYYGFDNNKNNCKMIHYKVFFDNNDKPVLDVRYSEDNSTTMNYYLNELEKENEEN